jgi:hypothetical protein
MIDEAGSVAAAQTDAHPQPAVYPQDLPAANDAQYARHAGFADLLRGFVIRWETLDFGVSGNCFDLEDRLAAWRDSGGSERPLS